MAIEATPPEITVAGETIPTKDGAVFISKPYRSRNSKKLRAAVAFVPRRSHFDIQNTESSANQFRGFFTLFWISIFIFIVRSYVYSTREYGAPLNLEFATMFSRDAMTLALSDGVLVLSTGLCVPFAKLIRGGWIRYHWTGVALQHILQTSILCITITWTFNRQWPWVQSGFLVLHTLVMIMKMHSYIAINGSLSIVKQHRDKLEKTLRKETERVGGYGPALQDARAHRRELDARNDMGSTQNSGTESGGSNFASPRAGSPVQIGTPDLSSQLPADSQQSYMDAPAAQALRNRLVNAGAPALLATPNNIHRLPATNGKVNHESEGREESTSGVEAGGAPRPHPLVDHPDARISSYAQELTELDAELVSSGPKYVRWPDNISTKDFAVYMLIPTLVYELEYPRTNKIRPLYVFEKTVATFGTFALLYSVTETYILPASRVKQSFAMSMLDLALPFMVAYLLLFFIIFECICNAFAELSYFADRGFYEDWWNSTSQDEFSRKWNKPVHNFLLRHVYAPLIDTMGLSRTSAMFGTFLLSACAHELVMAVVSKKLRMYLFTLQLAQIPMIAVGRIPAVRRNKLAGNLFFWIGLFAGFPLLCVAYVTY
ncbi:MBOAT-domain-containing protein [Peniophora sp. CONT]|nr:MBOAT-domain-containing protein [Peniophora sp. CONT]